MGPTGRTTTPIRSSSGAPSSPSTCSRCGRWSRSTARTRRPCNAGCGCTWAPAPAPSRWRDDMNRRLIAAGLALVALVAFGCAKGGDGVHPGDPGVPTSHVILTVTVRDGKGNLIVPAESPQWPNVLVSVLGEDAHGEAP